MQPPLDETGAELGLAILAVIELADVGRGDDDERRISRKRLARRDAIELVSHCATTHRRRQVGAAVQARRKSVDVVHDEAVRQRDPSQRYAE